MGILFMCGGSCLCALMWCCYRNLIPLTIEVIAAMPGVIMKYWTMLYIAVCRALGPVLWTFLCLTTALGFYGWSDRQSVTKPASQISAPTTSHLEYFLESLVYLWGGYVASNACHVPFCRVFGRWYFGRDGPGVVNRSLKMAFTSSFEPICFESLIIAFVRAMEQLTRRLRNDVGEQDNVVGQIVACVLVCITSCFEDILEWIYSYIFLQVALRSLSFMEEAKATYNLATLSNLVYIVTSILVDMTISAVSAILALEAKILVDWLGKPLKSHMTISVFRDAVGQSAVLWDKCE